MQPAKPYANATWRRLARRILARDPVCKLCLATGRVTASTVVDHIVPHGGDRRLFWDEGNLQGVCATCHSAAKRMQETHGFSQGASVDGLPIDPAHPWNRGRDRP